MLSDAKLEDYAEIDDTEIQTLRAISAGKGALTGKIRLIFLAH